jgi:hypothetical protein
VKYAAQMELVTAEKGFSRVFIGKVRLPIFTAKLQPKRGQLFKLKK